MEKVFKYVVKNLKTGKYWRHDHYPPLCDDNWQASKFDSAAQARSCQRALMADKYGPQDFKAVKIELIEHGEEE